MKTRASVISWVWVMNRRTVCCCYCLAIWVTRCCRPCTCARCFQSWRQKRHQARWQAQRSPTAFLPKITWYPRIFRVMGTVSAYQVKIHARDVMQGSCNIHATTTDSNPSSEQSSTNFVHISLLFLCGHSRTSSFWCDENCPNKLCIWV